MEERINLVVQRVVQDDVEVGTSVTAGPGEVVVRAIGSDLHMDYPAVGQTTHLAARVTRSPDPHAVAARVES
jgi:class 3 adenylate cyclase